jgi:hypothetical protein
MTAHEKTTAATSDVRDIFRDLTVKEGIAWVFAVTDSTKRSKD